MAFKMSGFSAFTKPKETNLPEEEQQRIKKAKELKEVLNEFMDKRKDLKEFEKELKKNKDMLTPGQVGDA